MSRWRGRVGPRRRERRALGDHSTNARRRAAAAPITGDREARRTLERPFLRSCTARLPRCTPPQTRKRRRDAIFCEEHEDQVEVCEKSIFLAGATFFA